MEPLKIHKAYEAVSGALFSGESTTFDEKDPIIKFLVKVWGKAGVSLESMFLRIFAINPSLCTSMKG